MMDLLLALGLLGELARVKNDSNDKTDAGAERKAEKSETGAEENKMEEENSTQEKAFKVIFGDGEEKWDFFGDPKCFSDDAEESEGKTDWNKIMSDVEQLQRDAETEAIALDIGTKDNKVISIFVRDMRERDE